MYVELQLYPLKLLLLSVFTELFFPNIPCLGQKLAPPPDEYVLFSFGKGFLLSSFSHPPTEVGLPNFKTPPPSLQLVCQLHAFQ